MRLHPFLHALAGSCQRGCSEAMPVVIHSDLVRDSTKRKKNGCAKNDGPQAREQRQGS